MRLSIEKGRYKAVFAAQAHLTSEQMAEVCRRLNGIIDAVFGQEEAVTPEIIHQPVEAPAKPAAVAQERPAFRDRLPNNLVDIKDLTVKQAVTENALVRCPECGQAHAIIVKSGSAMFLMRKDYDKNEFVVISEFDADQQETLLGVCCNEGTDRAAYFTDLQSFKEMPGRDFTVNNETELFCPVCQKSNAFIDWKEAYDNPLSRFETEHLCDACGGEVVEKVVKGHTYTKCESCGLERPSKEQA